MQQEQPKTPPWWKNAVIGGEVFTTKKSLQERIKQILHGSPLNTPLDFTDDLFMQEVFSHHPDWSSDAQHIEVRENIGAHYGAQRGFTVVAGSGAHALSYLYALDGKPSPERWLQDAARHAVSDQIKDAKKWQSHCRVCGVLLPRIGTHVDHWGLSFAELVAQWRSRHAVVQTIDGKLHAEFEDAKQKRDWQQFHAMFAELSVLHETCHKKITQERRGQ